MRIVIFRAAVFLTFITVEILADSNNIALKKLVYNPCSISVEKDTVITDGSVDSTNYQLIESTCKEKSIIRFNILLSVIKHIGSVTVYSGDCSDCDGLLDNFEVKLFSSGKKSTTLSCGHYSGPFLKPGMPMRVNCDLQKAIDASIMMVGIFPNEYQMNVSTKSAVSEIEVRLAEYYKDIGYYGCYENFESENIKKGSMTCKDACWSRGDSFMSSDNHGGCNCSSKVPKILAKEGACSEFCLHDDILCSTSDAYAVYIASVPRIHSLGCHSSNIADDAINSDKMTPIICIKHCTKQGKIYSFLQSASHCFCKDELNVTKTDENLCNANCTGASKSCGGSETALVYSGCLKEVGYSSCTEIYKCKNEDFDEFGICQSSCEDGWVDEQCLSQVVPQPPFRTTIPAPKSSKSPKDPQIFTTDFNPKITVSRPVKVTPKVSKDERKKVTEKKGLGSDCLRVIEKLKKSATTAAPHPDCKRSVEASDEEGESYVPMNTFLISLAATVILSSGTGFIFGYWYGKMSMAPKKGSEEKLQEVP